jgi:hypothetical protein
MGGLYDVGDETLASLLLIRFIPCITLSVNQPAKQSVTDVFRNANTRKRTMYISLS